MRRLSVAAVTVLALAASTTVLLPVGGSQAQPTGVVQAGERPIPLLSLELLGTLQGFGPGRPPTPLGEAMPHHAQPDDPLPGECFREGPNSPCVPVCTQFVASRECDRFPSAADGCLRFVASDRSRCLDAPPLAQPIQLSGHP